MVKRYRRWDERCSSWGTLRFRESFPKPTQLKPEQAKAECERETFECPRTRFLPQCHCEPLQASKVSAWFGSREFWKHQVLDALSTSAWCEGWQNFTPVSTHEHHVLCEPKEPHYNIKAFCSGLHFVIILFLPFTINSNQVIWNDSGRAELSILTCNIQYLGSMQWAGSTWVTNSSILHKTGSQ